jgi:hypothetical protein
MFEEYEGTVAFNILGAELNEPRVSARSRGRHFALTFARGVLSRVMMGEPESEQGNDGCNGKTDASAQPIRINEGEKWLFEHGFLGFGVMDVSDDAVRHRSSSQIFA